MKSERIVIIYLPVPNKEHFSLKYEVGVFYIFSSFTLIRWTFEIAYKLSGTLNFVMT